MLAAMLSLPNSLLALLSLSVCVVQVHAVSGQQPLKGKGKAGGYALGQAIPVTCLNRTVDTGEHITDSTGALQYIPFPTCAETNTPLSLSYGLEQDLNCTIPSLSDEFFHLLEFYIHADAPLTCRIPSSPLPLSPSLAATSAHDISSHAQAGALGTHSTAHVPLTLALAGTLQLSHLHVSTQLNLVLHADADPARPGAIDSAIAYSTSTLSTAPQHNTKIIIGDPLPLRFAVRWYSSPALPPGRTRGGRGWAEPAGGHVYLSTLFYCAFSALAGALVGALWVRGWEMPRRLRDAAGMRGGASFGFGKRD